MGVLKRLLLILLMLIGCSFQYIPTSPDNPVEEALISETEWAANRMGVQVRGEITNTITKNQTFGLSPDRYPTAWYNAGIAWYYRPQIKRNVSLTKEPYKETAKNVAVHEVCHARNPHHDLAHWECMNKWASPTYPRPGSMGSSSLSVTDALTRDEFRISAGTATTWENTGWCRVTMVPTE